MLMVMEHMLQGQHAVLSNGSPFALRYGIETIMISFGAHQTAEAIYVVATLARSEAHGALEVVANTAHGFNSAKQRQRKMVGTSQLLSHGYVYTVIYGMCI